MHRIQPLLQRERQARRRAAARGRLQQRGGVRADAQWRAAAQVVPLCMRGNVGQSVQVAQPAPGARRRRLQCAGHLHRRRAHAAARRRLQPAHRGTPRRLLRPGGRRAAWRARRRLCARRIGGGVTALVRRVLHLDLLRLRGGTRGCLRFGRSLVHRWRLRGAVATGGDAARKRGRFAIPSGVT